MNVSLQDVLKIVSVYVMVTNGETEEMRIKESFSLPDKDIMKHKKVSLNNSLCLDNHDITNFR